MSLKKYWLMKSDIADYSIDDFKRDKKTSWCGVRNYQARNFMRDEIKSSDLVLFYHSNSEPSGVAGIGEVIKESHPDLTALDSESEYYDPKATTENPIWFLVDIKFIEKFPRFVSLEELKGNKELKGMMVIQRGVRLSVQPVEKKHFDIVKDLGKNLS